jgi:hypothetical protein
MPVSEKIRAVKLKGRIEMKMSKTVDLLESGVGYFPASMSLATAVRHGLKEGKQNYEYRGYHYFLKPISGNELKFFQWPVDGIEGSAGTVVVKDIAKIENAALALNPGKVKWYEWGNEKPGMVSIWTVGKNHGVENMGTIPREKAREIGLEFECPYP